MRRVRNLSYQKWSNRDDRGSVLVELALVMPVLGLLLLVGIDLGLAVREHQILQNAVREAARFSAIPGNQVSPLNPSATLAAVQQRVIAYCQQEHITVSAAEITIDQYYEIPIGTSISVQGTQVTIVHTHPLLIIGAPFLTSGSLTLRASAVFRNMY